MCKLMMERIKEILLVGFILFSAGGIQAQSKQVGTRTIEIRAIAGLQYDVVRFKVSPGERLKLILKNEDDMAHNLVITKPGSRLKVVNAAMQLAEKGPQLNYVPPGEDVLRFIPVISPGQEKSVIFVAPRTPGVYPYVCTYPGHGFVMYGAMYVMKEGYMPDIRKDTHLPEARRNEDAKNRNEDIRKVNAQNTRNPKSGKNSLSEKKAESDASRKTGEVAGVIKGPHPYELVPPYWYHTMIDGVSPAVIAVYLPQRLSYCWDTENCRLRKAWKGDFLDMSDLWKGHFNASAKILGDIFWEGDHEFPIRLGSKDTKTVSIKYLGYRLVNQYPEFHYRMDDTDIFELIREKPDGNGLIRYFRIPQSSVPVRFLLNEEEDSIEYEFSAGKKNGNYLELSPREAESFSVTMTSYYLAYKYKKK